MTSQDKTFWDIERERTWRIYALFGFLLSLHFAAVFVIWITVKFLIYLRVTLNNPDAPFNLFGLGTLFVLIIAIIGAIIHWTYSSTRVVKRVLGLLGARYPDKYDRYHRVFENVVDEIEVSAGGLKVERYVLPTGAMNAFALADFKGRKVIGVTEGLLSRLTRDELQSVVAHEMAHIVSEDCLQITVACSLAGIYSEALARFNRALRGIYTSPSLSISGSPRRDVIGYTGFVVPVLVGFFAMDAVSRLLNMFISREREYRADAAAVRLTRNPISLASALYRIGTRWRGAGYGGEHISPIFILSPRLGRLDEEEGLIATMFSTHPPLLKRLRAILGLARADLTEITDRLRKERRKEQERAAEKAAANVVARRGADWVGPFTLLQLQTLDWLTPKTELRIGGANEIVAANQIPVLNHFFQKRNEPFWRMKRSCPVCRKQLVVEEYEGLHVWRCAFCDGMLAEQHKLPRIFVREEKAFTEDVQHAAAWLKEGMSRKNRDFRLLVDVSQLRPCARCGQPMTRKFYSYAYHVEIDQCRTCKLVWFDADELEILQCLIETEKRKENGV